MKRHEIRGKIRKAEMILTTIYLLKSQSNLLAPQSAPMLLLEGRLIILFC